MLENIRKYTGMKNTKDPDFSQDPESNFDNYILSQEPDREFYACDYTHGQVWNQYGENFQHPNWGSGAYNNMTFDHENTGLSPIVIDYNEAPRCINRVAPNDEAYGYTLNKDINSFMRGSFANDIYINNAKADSVWCYGKPGKIYDVGNPENDMMVRDDIRPYYEDDYLGYKEPIILTRGPFNSDANLVDFVTYGAIDLIPAEYLSGSQIRQSNMLELARSNPGEIDADSGIQNKMLFDLNTIKNENLDIKQSQNPGIYVESDDYGMGHGTLYTDSIMNDTTVQFTPGPGDLDDPLVQGIIGSTGIGKNNYSENYTQGVNNTSSIGIFDQKDLDLFAIGCGKTVPTYENKTVEFKNIDTGEQKDYDVTSIKPSQTSTENYVSDKLLNTGIIDHPEPYMKSQYKMPIQSA